MGRGADTPRGALLETRDLGILGVGIEAEQQYRGLQYDDGRDVALQSMVGYLFLTVDVCRWLTLSAGAGGTEAIHYPMDRLSPKSMWTAGLKANLWQHDVIDPSFFSSRLTIQLRAAYRDYDVRVDQRSRKWKEWRGALTTGAELFSKGDFGKDKSQYPYSLALLLGPYYSEVDMDDFQKDEEIGFLAGIDVSLSHNFSLGYEARFADAVTHAGNIVFHF